MKILLREDVDKLGKRGEVLTVSDGYARNYLIPKRLAMLHTPTAAKELAQDHKRVAAQETKKLVDIKALAEKMATTSVTIEAKVNEEGHLYGSITPGMIAEAFAKQGFTVDPKAIELEQPIKEVGVFAVKINLHPDVQPVSKIWIVQAQAEKS